MSGQIEGNDFHAAVKAQADEQARSQDRAKAGKRKSRNTESPDAVDESVLLGDSSSEKPRTSECYKPYWIMNGSLCRSTGPICNFSAAITQQIVFDDGVEQVRRLRIEGALANGRALPGIDVTTAEFARGDWPLTCWGSEAIVYAGQGTKDHLKVALQLLSGNTACRTTYGHTGWRKIDGAWFYLFANGAIGPNGLVDGISVELPDVLQHFVLAAPPAGDALVVAVRASLNLTNDLAPDRVILPLLAAVYRAVLPDAMFSVFLAGRTGTGKTELAASHSNTLVRT